MPAEQNNNQENPGCLPALLNLIRGVRGMPDISRHNIISGEVTKQMIRRLEKITKQEELLVIVRGLATHPDFQGKPFALNEIGDYINRRGFPAEALDIFAHALMIYPTLTDIDLRDMNVVKNNYEITLFAEHERAVKLWRTQFHKAVPIFEHVINSSQQVINGVPTSAGLEKITQIQTTASFNLHNTPPGFSPYAPKKKRR